MENAVGTFVTGWDATGAKWRQETVFSIDSCAKHALLLGPAAEDAQKAATNSDDMDFSAKRISTLKGHGDLYVYGCINHQIDVFCFQHYKPLKADAGWGNTWKSSTVRAQVKETDEV